MTYWKLDVLTACQDPMSTQWSLSGTSTHPTIVTQWSPSWVRSKVEAAMLAKHPMDALPFCLKIKKCLQNGLKSFWLNSIDCHTHIVYKFNYVRQQKENALEEKERAGKDMSRHLWVLHDLPWGKTTIKLTYLPKCKFCQVIKSDSKLYQVELKDIWL